MRRRTSRAAAWLPKRFSRASRPAPTPGFSSRRGCAPGEDRRCWTVPTDPARSRLSRRRARSAAPRRASGGGARRRASPRDGRRWSARASPIRAGSERRPFRCVRRGRRRARDGSRPLRPSGEATSRPRKGFSSEPIRARAGRGARRGERGGERRHPPNRRRRGGRSSWEPPLVELPHWAAAILSRRCSRRARGRGADGGGLLGGLFRRRRPPGFARPIPEPGLKNQAVLYAIATTRAPLGVFFFAATRPGSRATSEDSTIGHLLNIDSVLCPVWLPDLRASLWDMLQTALPSGGRPPADPSWRKGALS